jgi:hypothetical protein
MADETSREHRVFSHPAPIAWYIPDDLPSRYATNFVVQAGANEFMLSFFEARPPIITGSVEEVKAKIEQIESVKAICVARIIISREQMPNIIRALQSQLELPQPAPEQPE